VGGVVVGQGLSLAPGRAGHALRGHLLAGQRLQRVVLRVRRHQEAGVSWTRDRGEDELRLLALDSRGQSGGRPGESDVGASREDIGRCLGAGLKLDVDCHPLLGEVPLHLRDVDSRGLRGNGAEGHGQRRGGGTARPAQLSGGLARTAAAATAARGDSDEGGSYEGRGHHVPSLPPPMHRSSGIVCRHLTLLNHAHDGPVRPGWSTSSCPRVHLPCHEVAWCLTFLRVSIIVSVPLPTHRAGMTPQASLRS
jgi:hypothetical protein